MFRCAVHEQHGGTTAMYPLFSFWQPSARPVAEWFHVLESWCRFEIWTPHMIGIVSVGFLKFPACGFGRSKLASDIPERSC